MREQTIELSIDAKGNVKAIYQDEALDIYQALGTPQVKRAGHVEPHPAGGWQVDLRPIGGSLDPTPYFTRALALAVEEMWIKHTML